MRIFSFRAGRTRHRILAGLQAAAYAAMVTAHATTAPAASPQVDAPVPSRTWRDLPGPTATLLKTAAPLVPVSLAAADFDEDGMRDLAVGYTAGAACAVAIYRGNVDAVYPNAPEAERRRAEGRFADEPFLPEPLVVTATAAPDRLLADDFDADGHADLAFSSRDGGPAFVLVGDGRGGCDPLVRANVAVTIAGRDGAAVAAIPMRLNSDGVDDLVALRPGHDTPSVALTAAGSTFAVTNTNSAGAGSLRQAILGANAKPGLDQIVFNIPGAAPFTIRPTVALPTITDAVLLDATTQPGFAGAPVVELDGSLTSLANGLVVGSSSSGSVVRGLVINRFEFSGIFLVENADDVTIEGNYIGTDRTGLVAAPNHDGVFGFASGDLVVGGETPAARNVIAGNVEQVVGNRWTSVRVVGNYLGVDASGAAALAADAASASLAFRDVSDKNGTTRIGAPTPGARNVISGTLQFDATSRSVVIQNNYIGTDATGAASLGRPGAILLGESTFLVGGPNAGDGNVISGLAALPGIVAALVVNGSTSCVVQGNSVGTDATGQLPLGNEAAGIFVFGAGPEAGPVTVLRNVVAFNGGAGVDVEGEGARVSLHENSIHSNGGLGIDLDGNGVTENDPGDVDAGPNGQQNAPVVRSARAVGARTLVSGTLSSLPDTDFVVEIFASARCDSSGRGEGQRFLGSIAVRTDATGTATFDATLPGAARRSLITATATRVAVGTSEFSPCVGLASPTAKGSGG